mmetsp:Transcript_22166/g.50746  ORF Transcript_22166/g.50746 Transcript_22166/m.50746 type:complete len:315 (-) Transcript_22166:418-1362(-)
MKEKHSHDYSTKTKSKEKKNKSRYCGLKRQKFGVGTKVCKIVNSLKFNGRVTNFFPDKKYYRITYDDGDQEDLNEKEVNDIALVTSPNRGEKKHHREEGNDISPRGRSKKGNKVSSSSSSTLTSNIFVSDINRTTVLPKAGMEYVRRKRQREIEMAERKAELGQRHVMKREKPLHLSSEMVSNIFRAPMTKKVGSLLPDHEVRKLKLKEKRAKMTSSMNKEDLVLNITEKDENADTGEKEFDCSIPAGKSKKASNVECKTSEKSKVELSLSTPHKSPLSSLIKSVKHDGVMPSRSSTLNDVFTYDLTRPDLEDI